MALRPLLVACSLAVTIPLAACDAEEAISPSDVAKAAEATIAAGGSRLAIHSTVRVEDEELRLIGSGVTDRHESAQLDTKLSSPSLPGEIETMGMVLAGKTIYVRSSLFDDLPHGKEWIKLDLARATDAIGLSGLPELGSDDPRAALENLRAVADVEKLGEEEVRGMHTVHYRATVDLRQLPERVPATERAAARRSAQRLIALTGREQTRTEVWIDDDGLVRRTRDRFSMTQGKKETHVDETVDLFDFGIRARIEVPANSESVDVTELAVREARKRSK